MPKVHLTGCEIFVPFVPADRGLAPSTGPHPSGSMHRALLVLACVRGARTVAPSNNTLPRLSAIEIDIVRAQNLKQCDTFSLSDPFVVGYHGGEKIGQTKIINDTLSPIWRARGVPSCCGVFTLLM